jgi:hypothetical protein
MVLQVVAVRVGGVASHLVYALSELRPRIRQEVRLDAGVRGSPGRTAVRRPVDAAGRHRDQHPPRILQMRQNRVDRLAAEAGTPLRPVRVFPEAAHQLVGPAAVRRAEQRRRLGAGVDHVGFRRTCRRDLPDPLDRCSGVRWEGQRRDVRLLPRDAKVVADGDARAEMRTVDADEQSRRGPPRVDGNRVDRVTAEERVADPPRSTIVVAGSQEQALLGADR